MAKYSRSSEDKARTLTPKLAALFREILEHFDHSILGGIRSMQQQREYVARGLSKTLDSKHLPGADGLANAVDAAPYPQRWDNPGKPRYTPWDAELFYFGGFVKGFAAARGIKLRFGGDFNRNNDVTDSRFEDLDHFECEMEGCE